MSDINVNQLYDSVLKKKAVKYKTYESVLQLCHKKIKRVAENEKLYCLYTVPLFIIGTPLYDHAQLKQYIINSLKKSGFIVKLVNRETLYISWDLKDKKRVVKKQPKPPSKFRSIQDYNPTGKFVNDNTLAIKNISDKLHIIQL
tara:strand:+ start:98 stop:529 length:432 start_codon:yes stop_codon:yes gene_type:complete